MAAIYSYENGNEITAGLQGCEVCDEAIQAARAIASDHDEPVVLVDDDGTWIVQPSGTCRRATDEEAGADEADDDEVEPTVDRWITPPECQGQIVEVSYGVDEDSEPWRRVHDRSDRSTSYTAGEWSDTAAEGDWEPWNREPDCVDWQD